MLPIISHMRTLLSCMHDMLGTQREVIFQRAPARHMRSCAPPRFFAALLMPPATPATPFFSRFLIYAAAFPVLCLIRRRYMPAMLSPCRCRRHIAAIFALLILLMPLPPPFSPMPPLMPRRCYVAYALPTDFRHDDAMPLRPRCRYAYYFFAMIFSCFYAAAILMLSAAAHAASCCRRRYAISPCRHADVATPAATIDAMPRHKSVAMFHAPRLSIRCRRYAAPEHYAEGSLPCHDADAFRCRHVSATFSAFADSRRHKREQRQCGYSYVAT